MGVRALRNGAHHRSPFGRREPVVGRFCNHRPAVQGHGLVVVVGHVFAFLSIGVMGQEA